MRFLLFFSLFFQGVLVFQTQASEFVHQQKLDQIKEQIVPLNDFSQSMNGYRQLYSYTKSYGEFVLDQILKNKNLTGDHLNRIHYSLSAYLESTKELLQVANELDQDKKLLLELEIVESYREIYHVFYNETLLRRIVKDLQQFEDYGLSGFGSLAKQLLHKSFVKQLESRLINIDRNKNDHISLEIRETHSFKIVQAGKALTKYLKVEGHFSDRISAFFGRITGGLSAGFGAVVGNIEFRSGYMYQLPSFQKEIESKLRPLDLLFEKKTFKLTDKTIPGNWGHVALWLGTKAELVELGIWDADELAPFRAQIEAGNSVFEMRRWGMQFDSLENFLNLDEIAITRVRDILAKERKDLLQIYANLAAQLSKHYDFSFDAMATAKITCTEIVMLSYGNLDWPMDVVVGRLSITPNNMAEIALYENSPVDFIAYYRATELHKIQSLDINEFARVLEYRFNAENQNFERVHRICKNIRYRHQGAIRMRLKCHDEFEVRHYQEPAVFHF